MFRNYGQQHGARHGGCARLRKRRPGTASAGPAVAQPEARGRLRFMGMKMKITAETSSMAPMV